MEPEVIIKTITALTALVGSGVGFVKVFPVIRSIRKKRTALRDFEFLHAVYTAMERMQKAGAARVVVFSGHNCGGRPSVGRDFFVSALHWVLPDGAYDQIADYKEISVDAAYIRMLITIICDGIFHFDPDEQPACLLSRYYRLEGVSDSLVFYLGVLDNSLLYISACRFDGKFSEVEIVKLQLLAQQISNQTK